MNRLQRTFFERDTLTVAKNLLGKYLVREQTIANRKQKILTGRIVETEAYIGEDDLACHASKGRTNRTEIMYGEAGHAYVYMIYGMYHLLNIVTEKIGFPAAVLIRAVEPICVCYSKEKRRGISSRSFTHEGIRDDKKKVTDLKKLANGPGKLCRWMEIDRDLNGVDIENSNELYIVNQLPKDVILATSGRPESDIMKLDFRCNGDDKGVSFEIVEAKRIGVDYAKYCADHKWRFFIKGNEFVSRK